MGDASTRDIPMPDIAAEQPDQSDSDPIKATYNVFIKPSISDGRQIYILQFPNREGSQKYNEANQSQPLKFRVKPDAGMVELDVPLDARRSYDRSKGLKWGEAMKKSNMIQGGRTHGLPGGFGIGGAQPVGRGRGRGDAEEEIDQDRLLADFEGAIQRGEVLTKQTLGGQTVLNEETTPQYMVGTFRKNQLHLVPADHIVQMRPQFHHIDAHTEQERQNRPQNPSTLQPRVIEARAVHMTVKNPVDGEEETTDTMQERIAATQAEAWRHHKYIDENAAAAWESFGESLFVGEPDDESEELQQKVPQLLSAFDDGEYLNIISAPRDAARLSRSKRVRKDMKGKGREGEESDSSDGSLDSDAEGLPAAP